MPCQAALTCPECSLLSHSKIPPLLQPPFFLGPLPAGVREAKLLATSIYSLNIVTECLVPCVHFLSGIYPLEVGTREYSLKLAFGNGSPKRVLVWGREGAFYRHIQILMALKPVMLVTSPGWSGPSQAMRDWKTALGLSMFPGVGRLNVLVSPSGWAEPISALAEA